MHYVQKKIQVIIQNIVKKVKYLYEKENNDIKIITYNKLVMIMYSLYDAYIAAKILNIKFDKFSPQEFLEGINIESEHGTINHITNVTNDNLIKTAKIALAHLNEFPNYYNPNYGLKVFEEFLKSKFNKKERS